MTASIEQGTSLHAYPYERATPAAWHQTGREHRRSTPAVSLLRYNGVILPNLLYPPHVVSCLALAARTRAQVHYTIERSQHRSLCHRSILGELIILCMLTDIPSRTSPTLVSSILATELSICAYPTSVNPGTEFARPYRTQSTGTATGLTNAASSLLHDTFTSILECENMRPLTFPRRRYTRKLETPMQSSRSISSMHRVHVSASWQLHQFPGELRAHHFA